MAAMYVYGCSGGKKLAPPPVVLASNQVPESAVRKQAQAKLLQGVALQGSAEADGLRQAEALFGQACEAGLEEGCIRQAGFHYLGIAPFARETQLSRTILRHDCGRGHARSCEYYAFAAVAAEPGDGETAPTDVAAMFPFERSALESLCAREQADYCALLAFHAIAAPPTVPKNATNADADAQMRRDAPLFRKAAEQFARACRLGNLDSCSIAVTFGALAIEPSDAEAYFRDNLPLLEKSCGGGNPEGCAHLATLKFGRPLQRQESDPGLIEMLRRSCEGDFTLYWVGSLTLGTSAGSCMALGIVLSANAANAEQDRVATTYKIRACTLGLKMACNTSPGWPPPRLQLDP